MTQPHRTEIQVRFSDTDQLGHLNNTAFAVYAEQARVEFLDHLKEENVYLILAHLSLDFRRQVFLGERVHVLTRVSKVGNSSVTIEQEVYAADELAAEVTSVVVRFDYKAQKPIAIPDHLRAQLLPEALANA